MTETLHTWVLLRRLCSNVRRPPESLKRLQDRLLRAAVMHAYGNVPFYHRVWDEAGFDARSVRGIRDLERIPIITGRMVKEAAQRGELLARGVDTVRCTYLDTSGSSGTALRIWKQPREEQLRRAVGLRIWFEHGFRWYHVTAQFQIKAGPAHFLQRLGISRKTWISTEYPIDEQLALFLRARADVVVGTATALRRIARATEAASVGAKPPRTVFCAGELADIETRETVKRVFGIEPVGLYGQTEVGYVAWQCEQRAGFHVNADTHLVEILRDGRPAGPGELGTIVVTDLRARTMPLLRYDTADLAVAAAGLCACGRRLPLLGSIEGRARGSVLLEEGRVLTTRAIVDHLAGTLRLGEYRLHQETTSRFRLEMTPGAAGDRGVGKKDAYSQPDKVAILRHLRQILGEEVAISIETVRPWPSDGTGKTHTIFSVVPIPGLGPNRANR